MWNCLYHMLVGQRPAAIILKNIHNLCVKIHSVILSHELHNNKQQQITYVDRYIPIQMHQLKTNKKQRKNLSISIANIDTQKALQQSQY